MFVLALAFPGERRKVLREERCAQSRVRGGPNAKMHKKKLQPFACVLFSQFEALELQSSRIERLNFWHFNIFHLKKLLKPFEWLFFFFLIHPFLGSFALEIYLIEVFCFFHFTSHQNHV